jgi:hypothetical protein
MKRFKKERNEAALTPSSVDSKYETGETAQNFKAKQKINPRIARAMKKENKTYFLGQHEAVSNGRNYG